MEAVEYIKRKARMTKNCKASFCPECPLGGDNNGKYFFCGSFERTHPEEAVKIVEQWVEEHPTKTYKSVFLEKFPNARTTREGRPDFCLKLLCEGEREGDICSCDITCAECWNREYKESDD